MLRSLAVALAVMVASLAATSCVNSDLVACGDLVCPAGAICVGGHTCAHQDELDACTSAPDGQPCHVAEGDGQCAAGLCIPRICGDGIVEPGEVCDDGNVISSDGCRSDCLSDETCGNGITDEGEACDCGSAATSQPAACPTANSDDVTALCDPHCSRRCGDGLITGTEQCDGSAFQTTCTSAGFYAGAPSCSPFCTLDLSTCSGRCGDGILQTDAGEVCDGAPPAAGCVSFGRDYGHLGCSHFCQPDIASDCDFYGFTTLLPAVRRFELGAAANERGAVMVLGDGTAELEWDGHVVAAGSAQWVTAAANNSLLVLGGSAGLAYYDGTAWTTVAVPGGIGPGFSGEFASGDSLGVTDGGIAYALTQSCTLTEIVLATQLSSDVAPPPATACAGLVVGSDGALYVAAGDDGLLRFDGTTWTTLAVGSYAHALPGRPGHFIAKDDSHAGWQEFDTSTTPPTATQAQDPFADVIAIDGDGDEIDGDVFAALTLSQTAGASHAGLAQPFEFSLSGLTVDTRGRVLVWGDTGLLRLGLTQVTSGQLSGAQTHSLVALPDGALVACGSVLRTATVGTGGAVVTIPLACQQVVGDPRADYAELDETGNVVVFSVATQGFTAVASNVTALAGDAHSVWGTLGKGGVTHVIDGVPVDVPELDCTATEIAGDDQRGIYVLAACDANTELLRADASAWTILAVGAFLSHLTVAPDGAVFVTTESGTARVDGATLTQLMTTRGQIAATASNDVFVQDQDANGVYAHYDGSAVSQIRTPNSSSATQNPFAVTPNVFYAFDVASDQLVAVPRMPLEYPHEF